jgi:hypothetical protein
MPGFRQNWLELQTPPGVRGARRALTFLSKAATAVVKVRRRAKTNIEVSWDLETLAVAVGSL